ncbi:MAG: LysR substrate-binding domain-containing protein [Burkholderiaceae bacterium]|nr:LysR substrate-binding domain-containing protein [Burkholderiaceae bacterium]MCD8517477.1 LysR substrate-binding domain-containing protein [Burkholderiaceae bacterium]MCD8537866.1 LysR substrate-binding domain-containing protein [Burkholderiaceae bacterium]MCD8565942.1 LysR substrate-binding domain-containing protein [Burkholderiaceae bacterium]
MTPDQLITFSVVAEYSNISQAARALHLSQPAVSGQLQALQHSFGEALYRRHGRGIALTSAGHRLLGPANRLRLAMNEAIDARKANQTLAAGTIRIGASTTPASYLLPEIVAQFKRTYPGINVQMIAGNTGEIIARLAELDVAVLEGELSPDILNQCVVHPWTTDEVVAILPPTHPLAKRKSINLLALAKESLVMREDGSGVRNLVIKAFADQNLSISGYLELAGVEGIKQAVRAGLGVGFVSKLSLGHEDGTLVGISVDQGLTRSIRIVLPGSATPSKVTQAFMQAMDRPG